jgi:hypothetical protein
MQAGTTFLSLVKKWRKNEGLRVGHRARQHREEGVNAKSRANVHNGH